MPEAGLARLGEWRNGRSHVIPKKQAMDFTKLGWRQP
jgi:hypothetical protein